MTGIASAATKKTTSAKTVPAKTSKPTKATTTIKSANPSARATTEVKVAADAQHYYVLYAKPVASSDWELPVAIAKGVDGPLVLTDGRRKLADNRYRVETIAIAKPGDVDGDGVDDLTELADAPAQNPLSAVVKLDPNDGVAIIPDRAAFEKLSYQGEDVFRDSYLSGLEFVKFYITKSNTARPLVYVMNTETWRAHPMFAQAVGIGSGRGRGTVGEMRGDVAYYPRATAPDGTKGLYRFAFQPNDSYSFAEISVAYEALVNQMPFLAGKLSYYPFYGGLASYEQERKLYDGSRVPVVLEAQLVN